MLGSDPDNKEGRTPRAELAVYDLVSSDMKFGAGQDSNLRPSPTWGRVNLYSTPRL
jgi:hypothetical protein